MFIKIGSWTILLVFSIFILLKKEDTKNLKWELRSKLDIDMIKKRNKIIKFMSIIGIIFSIYMISISI
jgi:hypothetical protein